MKKIFAVLMMILCMVCFCGCASRIEDGEVDITMQDVMEANRMDVLIEEHDSIYVKQETIDISGFVRDTVYWYFGKENGKMTGDTWAGEEEETDVSNAKEGIICDLQGEDIGVTVIPEADYNSQVISMNPFLPTELEELESIVEEDDADEIILKTVREDDEFGIPVEVEYHLDDKTLQINRAEVYTYNGDGLKSSLVAMSVKYDNGEEPDRSAWEAVHAPSDNSFCEVTVIMEPGTEREEKRVINVAKSCDILVSGDAEYRLYRDEACRNMISDVDTTGDQVTVYAKIEN